jgi:hypothetical protein
MMRPSSILYMIAGLVFMAVIYFFNRVDLATWSLVYWIVMGLLACLALFNKVSRWPFIWGVALGFVVLVALVKFNYISRSSVSLPF